MDLYDSLLQSGAAQRLQRARVRAVPAQHSWVALPGPLVAKLLDSQVQTPLLLKLTPVPAAAAVRSPFSNGSTTPAAAAAALSPRPRYLAWSGAASTSPATLELPAHLASALQLPSGVEVLLEVLPGVAAAAAVVVEPHGYADWEVVELNAGLLEQHLLGQVGVVVLGQPLVVWARQAKVTLRVTQIIHDTPPAAAAAGSGSGRQLVLKDVARLDEGTELHIAPKPRIAAAGGSGLAPGELPLGSNPAAAAASVEGGQTAKQQQQQQQRKPVWLRVTAASSRHLLETDCLPGLTPLHGTNNISSNGGSDCGSSAAAADAASPPTPLAAAASGAVRSWLTTAVHISSSTAHDLQLRPGDVVRLYSNTSSSSSSSSKGQSVLPLQSLVLVVLLDEGTPWGHVSLSPPLLRGLGLRPHEFVKLRPLRQQQQQLRQLPPFLLHPLLGGHLGDNSSSSSSAAGGRVNGSAAPDTDRAGAAGVTPPTAANRPAAPASSASPQQRQPAGPTQQQQQQQQESFSGAGLVLDTVKGLLGLPLQVMRQQQQVQQQQQQQQQQQSAGSSPQQQQQQLGGGGQLASTAGGAGCGGLSDALVQPGVAAAAVLAWLQLQLAAAFAASTSGDAARGSSSSSSSSTPKGSWEVCLPLSGPMLVHFRVKQQQGQQQQQQELLGVGATSDFLLLLVPVGDQLLGTDRVAVMPAHQLLPQGNTTTADATQPPQQQQQQQGVSVQVGKALLCEPSLDDQLSPVAQQHSHCVTCITPPPGTPTLTANPQPQQQQQQQQPQQQGVGWLDPGEYPWLNPALQSCGQRLKPRLDLLGWQAWQSVGLPLPGGVLLVGGSEGGRGWLLQLLGQQAAGQQGAHVLKVSCKALAGQSYEAAAGVLAAAASECLARCPGLLLLDDLDLLLPAPNTDGPTGLEQDQATATRLSEWLAALMHWAATQPRPLAFAAAVAAPAALAPPLRAAGCLDWQLKVPVLGLQGRAALLLGGLRAKGLGFEGGLQGLEALAGKGLEGFDAKDLQLVVDRAVHSALRRGMAAAAAGAAAAGAAAGAAGAGGAEEAGAAEAVSAADLQQQQQQQQQLLVTAEDVGQALTGFVAAAFWRAGQHQGQQAKADGGLQGWEDVGGLSAAVSALKEALLLPAKYGHLLAAAPLRLRTGLLLFGPPGCGKSHVVAAAVAATGARLISVKGPELLNKYIGQSEAAVRELFSRAAAAAPCVLFFDEFDAIAPPRGHDSTGVTDRVVNQLLTELDGVEGLTGVAVLAATSRPDLIDAALLRPGRLDRMVYCGFPGEADRLAILQAVSRKLSLAPGVSLQDVAAATQGFTGADLAAILSEAQLLAVHDAIDSSSAQIMDEQPHPDAQQQGQPGAQPPPADDTAGGEAAPACELSAQHIQRALSRARPSLPAAEKQRLEAVYARFQQSRDPGLSNRPAVADEDHARVKHATLA